MNAAILAVGSELLGTDRLDTNSLRLTEVLEERGVRLLGKSVAGDVEAEIAGKELSVFTLPRSALRSAIATDAVVHVFVPSSSAGAPPDSGHLDIRQVDVARTEGDRVFVADGLADGVLVIVTPLEAAVDGMSLACPDVPGGAGER